MWKTTANVIKAVIRTAEVSCRTEKRRGEDSLMSEYSMMWGWQESVVDNGNWLMGCRISIEGLALERGDLLEQACLSSAVLRANRFDGQFTCFIDR